MFIRSEIRSQCRPPTWPDVWFKEGSRQKQGALLVMWHFWACPPICSHLEDKFPVWSTSKPRRALALFKRHPHWGTTEWLNETPVSLHPSDTRSWATPVWLFQRQKHSACVPVGKVAPLVTQLFPARTRPVPHTSHPDLPRDLVSPTREVASWYLVQMTVSSFATSGLARDKNQKAAQNKANALQANSWCEFGLFVCLFI